jgi:hypothetical protein
VGLFAAVLGFGFVPKGAGHCSLKLADVAKVPGTLLDWLVETMAVGDGASF